MPPLIEEFSLVIGVFEYQTANRCMELLTSKCFSCLHRLSISFELFTDEEEGESNDISRDKAEKAGLALGNTLEEMRVTVVDSAVSDFGPLISHCQHLRTLVINALWTHTKGDIRDFIAIARPGLHHLESLFVHLFKNHQVLSLDGVKTIRKALAHPRLLRFDSDSGMPLTPPLPFR